MPFRPSSQITFPLAGSYDTARLPLTHTTSVRSFVFHTNVVAHDDFSGRATRHFSSPDFLSNATRKDFSSLSHWTKMRSPAAAGELPVPQPNIILNDPMSFDQSLFPSRS